MQTDSEPRLPPVPDRHAKSARSSRQQSAQPPEDATMLRVRERVYDLNLATHDKLPYNPLIDDALADFFNIEPVRKHLVKQNLIADDGTIYDARTVRVKQAELDRLDRERHHQQIRDNADLEVHIATLVRERLEAHKRAHGPGAKHVLRPIAIGVNDHITRMIDGQFPGRVALAASAYGAAQPSQSRPASAQPRPRSPASRPTTAGSSTQYARRTREWRGAGQRPWRPSSLKPDICPLSESKAFAQRAPPPSEAQRSAARAAVVYSQRPQTAAAATRRRSSQRAAPPAKSSAVAPSQRTRPKTARTRSQQQLQAQSASGARSSAADEDDFAPATVEDAAEAVSFSPTASTRFESDRESSPSPGEPAVAPAAKSSQAFSEKVLKSIERLHIGGNTASERGR